MKCQECEELIATATRDGLETDAVAPHLARCGACRDYATHAREVAAILSEWRAPAPERSTAAAAREAVLTQLIADRTVRSAGDEAHAVTFPRRWNRAPLLSLPAFGTATAAVALLLAVLLLSRGGHQRTVVRDAIRSPMAPRREAAPHQPALATDGSRTRGLPMQSPDATGRHDRRSIGPGSRGRSPRDVAGLLLPGGRASMGDDLTYVNEEREAAQTGWTGLTRGEMTAAATPIRRDARRGDDFVTLPFPRLAALGLTGDRTAVAAVESYQREAAVVDLRLTREVTLALKATALSDLCDRLRGDTDIQLEAGPSVADEKVTLFCEKLPLREVMRQLARPFGYTWLRSGKRDEYRYELVQDLRSQLIEEELRNRDRNAALLALEREMQCYRPYLSLSPDEALTRSKTAAPGDKKLLEKLAAQGWGPIQMYFRLSRNELAALRAGQALVFNQEPGTYRPDNAQPGEQSLPPGVARGVLQAYRGVRIGSRDGQLTLEFGKDGESPTGLPPASVPEVRGVVTLTLQQSELGQFVLDGESGILITANSGTITGNGPYAVGLSPRVVAPDNRGANARLAHDPTMRSSISVRPQPSCGVDPSPLRGGAGGEVHPEAKVTSADVLEALYRATGMPIVADYYTCLYPITEVSVRNQPLFDTLNHLADKMRLQWKKEGSWLQFRSTSYYHDRLKEVPNRLLTRWAASRRQHGALPLDDLLEIAQLSDAQLDATEMAKGARECFGLREWDIARHQRMRPHLRCLAQLTPVQREIAMTAAGLPFRQMSLAQQRQFIAVALVGWLKSLEELPEAIVRVGYTQPGTFELKLPGDPRRESIHWALVREPTRMAALEAARRIDPRVDEAQVAPTGLAVTVAYTRGSPRTGRSMLLTRTTPEGFQDRWYNFPPERAAPPGESGR
jgi:hypothetical protein